MNKVTAGVDATILLKCEFFNPLGSVKDRIGMAMIEDAEKRGVLKKDTVIIEPTSGNTGIALAFVAAAKGYKIILTMPETMSLERRTLLAMLGAKLVLTPGTEGMKGAIARAEQLAKETPNSWIPQQFDNPGQSGNPQEDHRRGNLGRHGRQGGYFGFRRRHRRHHHRLRGGHQAAQGVLSGHRGRAEGFAGHFPDAGRPAAQARPAQDPGHWARGFIPKNLHLKDSKGNPQIVECIQVTNDDSFAMARRLAKEEGLLVGISTGANVVAAMEVAKRPANKGKMIVTVACSTGERYLEHPAGGGSQGGSGRLSLPRAAWRGPKLAACKKLLKIVVAPRVISA